MIMKKFEWVFFDLDGTLVDNLEAMFSVYLAFLKKYGKIGNKKEFQELNGPNISEIVEILAKKYELNENIKEMESEYEELISEKYLSVIPKKGTINVLKNLQKEGYKLALVTSNSKKNINDFLEKYEFTQIFDSMIFGDEVEKAKPSPEIYEQCLQKNNVENNLVIAIEDSENGVKSANDAGLECIKLENDFQYKKFNRVLREIENKRI